MAALPTRESLGGLPSARSGRQIARIRRSVPDTSAVGRGAVDLGRGISAIGDAATALQERELRERKYHTELRFQEFKFQQQQALEQRMRSVGPDEVFGFADRWRESYRTGAGREFFESIPDPFKPEYDLKLRMFGEEHYGAAREFAEAEQERIANQRLDDLSENVWRARARVAATPEELEEITAEAFRVIDENPNIDELQKAERKREYARDIALSFLDAQSSETVEMLVSPEAVLSGELPTALMALSDEDRQRILESVETHQRRVETEIRSEAAKTGYDMLLDDEMNAEWLAAHRDVLSVSDYKTFLRALEPDVGTRKTEPREYLRLYDLAQTDPEVAIDEVRELYANDLIAKDDFKTLHRLAQRSLEEELGRDYSNELRNYVKRMLQPDAMAADSAYARQLDAMFAFDDWLEENPKARREEMREQADTIVADFKKIRYGAGVTELPLPRHIAVPRDDVTPDELEKAKERLQQEVLSGVLDEREAAQQAALLRRWYAIVGGRD